MPEQTLIIIKPDCLEARHTGDVIARFESAGFSLVAAKMRRLDETILREHYAHIADRPFFPEIADFMGSRPVLFLILEGDNVVARVRDLLGPTDSAKADKGTIRGDYGTDVMRNIAHASDSPENARIEIARFFDRSEIPA